MQAQIHDPTPSNLRRLAAALRRGELVALPTETVYGLAANALNARACQKIFRVKGRPPADPLIVHVLGIEQAGKVAGLNPAARKLARAFWPGPLTMVLSKKATVPGIVTAGLDSIAVRSPAHPVCRKILRLSGLPLAAPSANPFGYVSPTQAEHVREGLGRRLRHILNGGACRFGLESTIVDLRDPTRPVLLRPGVIAAAQLARVLGRRVVRAKGRSRTPQGAQIAPGLMQRHYSPKTELRLFPKITPRLARQAGDDVALLYFQKPSAILAKEQIFWLSTNGSAKNAARRLYDVLRAIDRGRFRCIYAERVPSETSPLAEAINDRLTRAATRR